MGLKTFEGDYIVISGKVKGLYGGFDELGMYKHGGQGKEGRLAVNMFVDDLAGYGVECNPLRSLFDCIDLPLKNSGIST